MVSAAVLRRAMAARGEAQAACSVGPAASAAVLQRVKALWVAEVQAASSVGEVLH